MNNSEIDQDNDSSVEQKGSNPLEQCLAHLHPETELQVIFSTCTTQFLSSSSLCTSLLSCVVSIPETEELWSILQTSASSDALVTYHHFSDDTMIRVDDTRDDTR